MAERVPATLTPGAKIMFVGQAPASEEMLRERPLVGPSGRELDRMLSIAGIARAECAVTNVFDERIPGDRLDNIVVTTAEAKRLQKEDPAWADYHWPAIKRGYYLRPEWTHHLHRLQIEIAQVEPNIVVALGDEALWALTGTFGIKKRRGAVTEIAGGRKMLATYHPAYVLRNYTSRIAVIGDLIKVKRESETREIVFPHRELWLSPTLADIAEFKRAHLDGAELISVDIETAKGQITEIGFAPSRHLALVVPFTDYNLSRNYWATAAEEARAWGLVRDICGSPVPKLLQNGLYDQYWLWMKAKIKIRNYLHDTRLLHHALYPELPKDLASMVATYESAPAWKHMRARKTEKRDE